MKRVAIVQSSYVPWMGYFGLIEKSDEFIFLDDVQYTKRDWRNRNFVKTANGPVMLTVPVCAGARSKSIEAVEINGEGWAARHWATISQAYAKAAYFATYEGAFRVIYENPPKLLSVLNRALVRTACDLIGIKTKLSISTDYGRFSGRNERLVSLCAAAGATHYLSGPAAKAYLTPEPFKKVGIEVEFMVYDYPAYRQLHGPFLPNMSILDLIFNEGPRAIAVIRGES